MPRFTDWLSSTGGATTAEAVAGTSTSKVMTPARVPDILPIIDARRYGLATAATATVNRAALQSAIDAANGLYPVYIPPGTFLIDGTRTGPFDALVTYMSGTKVIGAGPSSVIKVADGVTTAGDYRVFAPPSTTATDNILFANLTMDGNAANNLVLGSSGGNVRRAHSIYVDNGTDITIKHMTFVNNPGRNVVALGNNASSPSIKNGRVINCAFRNVGGAVSGNHLQNDHSSVYIQSLDGLVANNVFENPAIVDPSSPAARVVAAIEAHGSRTLVRGNHVVNFTSAGNAASTVQPSIGNGWVDNTFEGISQVGVSLWSNAAFTHSNLRFARNLFRMHGDLNTLVAVIYQANTSASVGSVISGLRITDNSFEADDATPRTVGWSGVRLSAVNGGAVSRNRIVNTQGPAIYLVNHSQAALDLTDVSVRDNQIVNAGFMSGAAIPFAVLAVNAGTMGNVFRDINMRGNSITKPAAAGTGRGYSVQGAGRIERLTIGELGLVRNIANLAHIAANTGTNTSQVVILPRVATTTTALAPDTDVWRIGDQVLHSDVAASGTVGKVCATAGGASSAVWAISTAYTVGQWIRTSGGKVLECTTAGTSHGSTEPNPSVLGDPATDGTVTWAYRSATLAVFKTFGAVAA